jgi:hypothetical protein
MVKGGNSMSLREFVSKLENEIDPVLFNPAHAKIEGAKCPCPKMGRRIDALCKKAGLDDGDRALLSLVGF